MKLPWWLRRSFVQAQRTVHEAEMAADAYRARQAGLADEDREVIAAMRRLGDLLAVEYIVATSKPAPVDDESRRLEALYDMPDAHGNTRKENQ